MLPTGTVTFLFTDIEGSTKLARNFPDLWPSAQARLDGLLQTSIVAHHGYVFRQIGDEFDAAFETPIDALEASIAAQRLLHSVDWGELGQIRVRMGVHTGPATENAGDYEGYLTLSYTKRLMSSSYGDQILVSEATRSLLGDSLPPDFALRDLGLHRLKDFERGEHIFQIVSEDLPADFPPLKSLERPPNRLPIQLTSFIGRSKEIDEVRQLIFKERLVTLTGPGGSGKTRLALQVASEMSEHFADGIFFVGLAPITDSKLVASTIAQALGIHETAGQPLIDSIKEYLENKSLLLLLDNFEQVISAAPLISELMVAAGELKVLATSREGLHIRGEQEFPVPPLDLPDVTQPPEIEHLSQYPAVELFTQRARAVKPDFRITRHTAQAIIEICCRLEGLPLAIELAAARIKLMSPTAMLARMEHSLEFLTSSGRDLPARQQTLRNTIAWSYDLLDENEQKLFRQLSVFAGGCTLEAVEALTEDQTASGFGLDLLGSLLDKSMLREIEGIDYEPRFVMLEMLREFGLEQLEANGEQEKIRLRHATYFLDLAEQVEASIGGEDQVEWMNCMEQEHDNLRSALEWSRTAPGAGDLCMRLAGAVGLFWEARGYFSEGRERLSSILMTEAAQGRTVDRAKLLARAAELAYRQSDYLATTSFAMESLAIYREVGDRQGIASELVKLGNAAMETGDYATASGHLEEALNIWRELGDTHGIARALISLGWAALRSGDDRLANDKLEEALSISRESGDTRRMGFELSGLGEVAMRQGDFLRARRLADESLELRMQLGNKWGVGVSLGILGWIAMHEGDWNRAAARLGESLAVRREIGDKSGSAWCLERLAEVAQAQGQVEKSARLYGAAAGLRASISSVIDPIDRPDYENKIRSLRAELGDEQFSAHWEEGQSLKLDQALTYALER